jgi:hypothetical protein
MIKEFPVYTEAEKKQIAEGRSCIKLSKGQPIYPRNFKKRRDTFAGADYTTANPRDIDPNNIYIPPYFRLKIIMAIIINFDRAIAFNRISDNDFKLGMTYRFIYEHVGSFKCFEKAYSMVSLVVDNELSIMRSIGDYNYKWNMRKIYPSCFVSKAKFRYIGGDEDTPSVSSKERANKARKAAVDHKVMIMVSIIDMKSVNSIKKIVKSDGGLKNDGNRVDGRNNKVLFKKFNDRLVREGFKEMKISSLYKYLKSALEFLGVSLLELRAFADRAASDIENGKKGYVPDLCSLDNYFDVCSFMEDS